MRRSLTISGFRLWISDLMSSVFSVPPSETIYTANELNQYISRTVPDTVSIIGSAPANVDVYVNGTPADRQGPYWHSIVTVNNVPSPVYAEIEILGVSTPVNPQDPPEYSIDTNHVFVAQNPELFEYDLDGNLTKDGGFVYSWNGENRLICVETRNDLPVGVPRYRINYAYDFAGRMVFKEISDPTNNSQLETKNFLWDNWNIIAENTINHQSLTTNSVSYVWGIDLSGSLQGAGGVGGLLAVIKDGETFCSTYDANGNVSEYVDNTGTIVAHREYDAFGNTVVATGDTDTFLHWFSTKLWCPIIETIDYQLRPNKPRIGRWLNRDSIGEQGGLNLYGFVENGAINKFDVLGLWTTDDHVNHGKNVITNLTLSVNDACKKKILDQLTKANKGQDNYPSEAFDDYPRHFNRMLTVTREEGRKAYNDYLEKEEKKFSEILTRDAEKMKWEDCAEALDALGRLLHSWQDFFGHSYHPEYQWNAWSNGTGGTPSEPGNLFPSSYSGLFGQKSEHHWKNEPFGPKSEEYKKRREASDKYTKEMLEKFLNNWLNNEKCKCFCEDSPAKKK